jgi:hypothetical protein
MLQQLIVVTGLLYFCINPSHASSLKSLSQPKTQAEPIPAKTPKIVKKQTRTKPKIESAILIELPEYQSLVTARSQSEVAMVDQKALELLFQAASNKNPELTKAIKIINKNFARGKEQAIDLIENSKAQLEQEYRIWRAFYPQHLINITDQASLLEVEKLIKGNR